MRVKVGTSDIFGVMIGGTGSDLCDYLIAVVHNGVSQLILIACSMHLLGHYTHDCAKSNILFKNF